MAAGMGMRLGGKTTKALIEIEGRPLCHYAFDFLRAAGADNLIVIGGFCFEELARSARSYDKDILILENNDYKKGNLYTLEKALPHINGSFLLCNSDHIYRKPIAKKVAVQLKDITAFCDFDRNLGDDDMKVWHNDFKLAQISKKLTDWNGGYVGLTYCDKEKLDVYKATAHRLLSKGEDNVVAEDVLRILSAENYAIHIGDISGHGWLEVDFPEELERARREIASGKSDFIFSEFDNKWKNINIKKSADEASLFVDKGGAPATQRQINLYWYYRFLKKILDGRNYKKGLEIGCGRGTMSLYLRKYENLDATLLDLEPSAIELAKENFKLHGAEGQFVVAPSDVTPFPDNGFDIVYSIGLLEHLKDYRKTLEECYRILKPGGAVVHLNIPAKWSCQNLNNIYKKILNFFTGKEYSGKDYWRNSDKPEDYTAAAEAAGFTDCKTVNVNPFPIFVPMPRRIDKKIALLYRFVIKIRSLFMEYPFETNYRLSQGHFLVGYKSRI